MSGYSFEHLSAMFIASAARSAPKRLVSSVLASPLSARNSDICMLWHPGYRKRHGLRLAAGSIVSLAEAFLKGIVKLLVKPRPFGYALYGAAGESVLVITAAMCGSETPDGKFKTPYVETEEDDALFVFGLKKDCGRNPADVNELPVMKKAILAFALIKSGISAFTEIEGRIFDKCLLLLKWLSWVLSLRWLHDYYLEEVLSGIVEKHGIKKIGCIHEMHFYSRTVWRVAAKYNCRGYTVQHAAFSKGKRWYFCFPEETESGLRLPDVMYVYSGRVSDTLKQYYKNTLFRLGCSARYAHWKNVSAGDKKGGHFLFAGALARFDNEVLISSLQKAAAASPGGIKFRLRLHPFADLSCGLKRWIRSSEEKGIISVSRGRSLKEDIENASAVIGMSTTVLEEALIMGRPVVQITHPEYLEYIDIEGIDGVQKADYTDLSFSMLKETAGKAVDVAAMRDRLGLNNPVITYKRLFGDA
ncbi:MAG: hypothetical protein HY809_04520 [Nitrospirae bacterium]|nr:hypothetical protein [Nitrospirota bacterium]